MNQLRITLIADGRSDSTLLEVIKWVLDNNYPEISIQKNFADFNILRNPPKTGDIAAQIACAKIYYPFDLLFYHRDAESRDMEMIKKRKEEILRDVSVQDIIVCVIPVEMMEAWFLIDKEAIKKAAGNRNYDGEMDIPSIQRIEMVSNPKEKLHDLLKKASGLKGRRLKNFNVYQAVHLVAENILDFSPLRQLSAFQSFENDLKEGVSTILAGQ
ncbi:MAG: DUF4276 family protein [Sphingobacteriales bacterium]|nr:DUF4276 family protein [Sphingobacteriales bacterium]